MKRSTLFLKAVILLIGIGTLAGMIIFPQLEGRNTNADLFNIYFQDPFLAYMYIASIPFFVALYQAFQLLGYIGQNKVFSLDSVRALRTIKYCAIILSILIVMAALYIRIFHAKEDDPAGFIVLCILTTFISVVIAIATAVFERLLQSAVDIKSENDLTV
ncbi:MAG TPA: DUF2975 domain-containing protein [Methanobacteriaceae archaeon]|nr:DUF2975 domain-containing protein [Methanobacteriaceae archaeon]